MRLNAWQLLLNCPLKSNPRVMYERYMGDRAVFLFFSLWSSSFLA